MSYHPKKKKKRTFNFKNKVVRTKIKTVRLERNRLPTPSLILFQRVIFEISTGLPFITRTESVYWSRLDRVCLGVGVGVGRTLGRWDTGVVPVSVRTQSRSMFRFIICPPLGSNPLRNHWREDNTYTYVVSLSVYTNKIIVVLTKIPYSKVI